MQRYFLSKRSKFPFTLVTCILALFLFGLSPSTIQAASILHKVSPRSHASASSTQCGTWNVISSPNNGSSYDVLNGVSALSPTNAWAVGDYNISPGPLQTLIEHWDGTQWSIVPSPNQGTSHNILNSVAALSVRNVWAVGYVLLNTGGQKTLIEHWNGIQWSIVPSPNQGMNANTLTSVIQVPGTRFLWAVGYYWDTSNTYEPLVEYWNGINWSIISTPQLGTIDNLLNSVTAVSSNNVWVVGTSNNLGTRAEITLTEHWNGNNWSVVSSPNIGGNGYFHGVTRIPGTTKLMSVGEYNNSNTSYETLAEYWNGTSWRVVPSPNPGPIGPDTVISLLGTTAISANSIWAVGLYQYSNGMTAPQTLITHWNGSSWSIVASPNPGSGSVLAAVSRVPGSTQVWAVGETEILGSGYQTLIEFSC